MWFGLSGLKTQHKFWVGTNNPVKSGVGWFEKVAWCLNLMFSSFQDPSRESTVLCAPWVEYHGKTMSVSSLHVYHYDVHVVRVWDLFGNRVLLAAARPMSRTRRIDQQRTPLPKHGRKLDATPLRQRDNMFIVRSILLLMHLNVYNIAWMYIYCFMYLTVI